MVLSVTRETSESGDKHDDESTWKYWALQVERGQRLVGLELDAADSNSFPVNPDSEFGWQARGITDAVVADRSRKWCSLNSVCIPNCVEVVHAGGAFSLRPAPDSNQAWCSVAWVGAFPNNPVLA